MAKGKQKKPKVVALRRPDTKRTKIAPSAPVDQRPLWAFGRFDNAGDWCWSKIGESDAMLMVQRLKGYEGMTWTQIQQARHNHFIEPREIIPKAQRRLRDLGRGETDALFSMSLGGKIRLWGVRRDGVFFALWWDPNHEIYPTKPK